MLAVVEEELAPLQDQIERLRADMNKLMEARHGTVLSVTHRKRSSRGVDRVRLSKQGLEGFKKQNRWISAGWIGASAAAWSAASPSAMRPMCFGTAGEARRSCRSPRNGSEIPVIERVIVMSLKPLLALSAILQRQRLG